MVTGSVTPTDSAPLIIRSQSPEYSFTAPASTILAFTILTSVVWSCLFYGHFPDSLPDLLPCYRHHTVPQLSSVISLYPSAKTRSVISFCNMPIYLTSVILTIDSLLLSLPALFYIIMLPHYFFNQFSPVTVSNCWWRLQYRNREVVP